MLKPRNDRNLAVTKFCLSMEEHRRTEMGRVRTAREFVANFFPYSDTRAVDKVFNTIPNEVRGPILSSWGIRGTKAALKDDDDKVRGVVHDALVAGDIDETLFEDGITPQILIDWIALPDWWSFWRQGKLTGVAIQKALATARELALIDDRWFLANVQGRGGKLKGTDVICDTLSKDQIVAWIRKVHESGNGSPAGLVAALGWETILTKTAQDALVFALDAFAKKAGLVVEAPAAEKVEAAQPATNAASVVQARPSAPAAGNDAAAQAAPATDEADTTAARTDAPAGTAEDLALDAVLAVAIPDIPVIDSADNDEAIPIVQDQAIWNGGGESPKLAEARTKMMEMLGNAPADSRAAAAQEGWT
ncbi:MAG TPA: hypothetical protein VM580_19580, partial [Labilithrix sp.]|nr:hypothetical protein [Labilithrix sp.]